MHNASNGFAHDDNKRENFGDEKHFKTLSEISISSNERQSQKNPALYISLDQKRFANKWKKS